MAKVIVPKGKKVKGCNYVGADEEFDKKRSKKELKEMSTAGVAKEMKKSQKDQGYSKIPQVKPQKKAAKPVMGQRKIY